jgi:long-chain acyl-CoA synthetase
LSLSADNALDMFRASLGRSSANPLIHYLDQTITIGELDAMSDALAVKFCQSGMGSGDRIAVMLQNVPQFVIALLAAWKINACVVPINPMYKETELTHIFQDSRATALIALDSLFVGTARTVVKNSSIKLVITTAPEDNLCPSHWRTAAGQPRPTPGDADLLQILAELDGHRPPSVTPAGTDLAFLTYTSGTTGPAKGAMNTHGNVVFSAHVYRDWVGMTPDDVVLGMAPLFHITGLIAHIALCLLVPAPLVLGYRFDPRLLAELAERYGATFTIGAITAYTAMLNELVGEEEKLRSLRAVYSGGQPVPAAIVDEYERRFGTYIRLAYGLTETTSPTHLVPSERRSPVDVKYGALAVGVPVFDTVAAVMNDDDELLPPGELGEIVVRGPQVVPGYWEKPEETERAFRAGWFHTGDVGFMDEDGWFYVVDRKKDLIIASGYKVWPREVEDVLYQHPGVNEAAVIGIPDEYRGETVKAVISLRPGSAASAAELMAFCRERLAAYKCPHIVEFLDEIPKTASGKILRRSLRG